MENLKKLNGFTVIGLMCFLVMVFTCVNPNYAIAEVDKLKVATYEQDLNNLDANPKASGKAITTARDLYFKTFTEKDSQETRDAAFLVFEKLYSKIAEVFYEDTMFDKVRDLFAPPSSEDLEEHHNFLAAQKIAEPYGYLMVTVEGDLYSAANYTYLAKAFGNLLSPALKALIIFNDKTNRLVVDAMLTVSFEGLRERILLGDEIIKKFPGIASQVQKGLHRAIDLYLLGTDHDPVYHGAYLEGIIAPEVKDSYIKFLKENKDSTYYPHVKYVYDLLEKNNFMYTEKIFHTIVEKLRKDGIM